jgi:hypothetical protein
MFREMLISGLLIFILCSSKACTFLKKILGIDGRLSINKRIELTLDLYKVRLERKK